MKKGLVFVGIILIFVLISISGVQAYQGTCQTPSFYGSGGTCYIDAQTGCTITSISNNFCTSFSQGATRASFTGVGCTGFAWWTCPEGPCASYSTTAWVPAVCNSNRQQTRVVTGVPSGCYGGTIIPPPDSRDCDPICTYWYSWPGCSTGQVTETQNYGFQNSPTPCEGAATPQSRPCTPSAPSCTYSYGAWTPTTCPASGIQTRTYSSSPDGCVGFPQTSRTCDIPVIPVVPSGPYTNLFSGTSSCAGVTIPRYYNELTGYTQDTKNYSNIRVKELYRTTSDYTRSIARSDLIYPYDSALAVVNDEWEVNFTDDFANIYPYYNYSFDIQVVYGGIPPELSGLVPLYAWSVPLVMRYPLNLIVVAAQPGSCALPKPMKVKANILNCTSGEFKLFWTIPKDSIYTEAQGMQTMKSSIFYATSPTGPFYNLLPAGVYANISDKWVAGPVNDPNAKLELIGSCASVMSTLTGSYCAAGEYNYSFTYNGNIPSYDNTKTYYFKVVSEPRYNVAGTPLRATPSDIVTARKAIVLNWAVPDFNDAIAYMTYMLPPRDAWTGAIYPILNITRSIAGANNYQQIYYSNSADLLKSYIYPMPYEDDDPSLISGQSYDYMINLSFYPLLSKYPRNFNMNKTYGPIRKTLCIPAQPVITSTLTGATWKNPSTGGGVSEVAIEGEVNLSVTSNYPLGTPVILSVYNAGINNALLFQTTTTANNLGEVNYKSNLTNLVGTNAGIGDDIYFNAKTYNYLNAIESQVNSSTLRIVPTPELQTCNADNRSVEVTNSQTGAFIRTISTMDGTSGAGQACMDKGEGICCPNGYACNLNQGCVENTPVGYSNCSQVPLADCENPAVFNPATDPLYLSVKEVANAGPFQVTEPITTSGRACGETGAYICSSFECTCKVEGGACTFSGTTTAKPGADAISYCNPTGGSLCLDTCSTSYTPTGACTNDLQTVTVASIWNKGNYNPALPNACTLSYPTFTCPPVTSPQTVPCGRALAALPAFGIVQAIVGIVIIALAYFIYLRFARTKNRRARTRGKKKHKKS